VNEARDPAGRHVGRAALPQVESGTILRRARYQMKALLPTSPWACVKLRSPARRRLLAGQT